jgi:hypothetical protein
MSLLRPTEESGIRMCFPTSLMMIMLMTMGIERSQTSISNVLSAQDQAGKAWAAQPNPTGVIPTPSLLELETQLLGSPATLPSSTNAMTPNQVLDISEDALEHYLDMILSDTPQAHVRKEARPGLSNQPLAPGNRNALQEIEAHLKVHENALEERIQKVLHLWTQTPSSTPKSATTPSGIDSPAPSPHESPLASTPPKHKSSKSPVSGITPQRLGTRCSSTSPVSTWVVRDVAPFFHSLFC